jgi:sigma-54-dependent transcriptional regulator
MLSGIEDPIDALEAFIRVTSELSSERDLTRLLDSVLGAARRLTGCKAGRIYLLDHTKRYLVPAIAHNDVVQAPTNAIPQIPLFSGSTRNAKSLGAYVALTGEVVAIDDVYQYSGFDCEDLYTYDRRTNYRSTVVLTVPMKDHAALTLGILQLIDPRPESGNVPQVFTDPSRRLVLAFASQAAVAVENAQLIDEKQRLIERLSADHQSLSEENRSLKRLLVDDRPFPEILGQSTPIKQVFLLIQRVLKVDTTVLVLGETGTGKELVARAIHNHGNRAEGPFVAQNCAAVPEELLESELFGYRRGAFTGATKDKKGLFEMANGGTLFLDEIGDMPLGLQAKLLRVLQEKEVRPLGDVKGCEVDVRVIAATHQDLKQLIAHRRFRPDLFYRLSVFPIRLPPLRERRADLQCLVEHLVSELCTLHGRHRSGITSEAWELLFDYDYPGNIRELKNLLERAVLISDEGEHLSAHHFPGLFPEHVTEVPADSTQRNLPQMVRNFEASVIRKTLEEMAGNQTNTAKHLGISRRTLVDKLTKLGIRGASADTNSGTSCT